MNVGFTDFRWTFVNRADRTSSKIWVYASIVRSAIADYNNKEVILQVPGRRMQHTRLNQHLNNLEFHFTVHFWLNAKLEFCHNIQKPIRHWNVNGGSDMSRKVIECRKFGNSPCSWMQPQYTAIVFVSNGLWVWVASVSNPHPSHPQNFRLSRVKFSIKVKSVFPAFHYECKSSNYDRFLSYLSNERHQRHCSYSNSYRCYSKIQLLLRRFTHTDKLNLNEQKGEKEPNEWMNGFYLLNLWSFVFTCKRQSYTQECTYGRNICKFCVKKIPANLSILLLLHILQFVLIHRSSSLMLFSPKLKHV